MNTKITFNAKDFSKRSWKHSSLVRELNGGATIEFWLEHDYKTEFKIIDKNGQLKDYFFIENTNITKSGKAKVEKAAA